MTKVGFGAQYAAALIINKCGLRRPAAGAADDPARGRAGVDGHCRATRSRTSTTTAYGSVAENFPGATTFELPREEQAKWAAAMPNIAKEWAERIDAQGLPGTAVLCRLHGRNAERGRRSGAQLGPGLSVAHVLLASIRGRRTDGRLRSTRARRRAGAPRRFALRQRDAGPEYPRHAADPRDGGGGQCRRDRTQPLQPSDPRRRWNSSGFRSSRSSSCRWRTRCARAGTFRTTFSPSL